MQRRYDRRLWPEMREAIAAAVRRQTLGEWCARLEGSDACFAPVLAFEEAPLHAHAQARGAFVSVDGIVQPAPAPRFDRTPAGPPRRAPAVGEHSTEVLLEAGFSDAEVAALFTERVAAGATR